ncbi:hypothetical protein BSU04_01180 [Caballeronia sordidicola]|uniref:Uncharacterized protein n=1 Tax=Caballeronia sordidicola TaxID=196367 RepID=A0A226XCA0_CABSO|nr:hypothetical protein BSU04_01180 [Caballeronia sordidicola]
MERLCIFALRHFFVRLAQAALILVSLTHLPCSVTDTPFTQATTQTC